MFNKTPERAPTGGASLATGTAGKSVLAPDLHIQGDLVSTGTVEILGQFEGKITSRNLIVGAEGRVTGSIAAESVDLRGQFNGSVATQSLALRSACDVQAELLYSTLSIESGALIEGQFKVKKP